MAKKYLAEREWEYAVQICHGIRNYKVPPERPELDGGWSYHERRGMVWSLYRVTHEEGDPFFQSLMVSPEVFDTQEEAERDALEKLSMLACPIERPVIQALRWLNAA